MYRAAGIGGRHLPETRDGVFPEGSGQEDKSEIICGGHGVSKSRVATTRHDRTPLTTMGAEGLEPPTFAV